MTDEVDQAANAWLQDSSGAPEAVDLSDAALNSMRKRALLSLQLEPLPPGNNDGRVYYRGSDTLAFDSNGHEAFAEFISNAQPWVVALVSELLRLRQGLEELARDPHAPDCHRVTPDHPGRYLSCACHLHFIRDLIERELVQETRSP